MKTTINYLAKKSSLKIFLLSGVLLTSCYAKNIRQNENEEYFSQYKNTENIFEKVINNDETTFVAFGDYGTGDANQYKVAKAVEAKCAKDGCDFGLLLGDNIYYYGVKDADDNQFIEKFEQPYKNLNFKFYATLGNHDYRGNTQAQIDYTQKSKKWVMPGRTYTFNYNNIEFFSIDSNAPSDIQSKALENSIKTSQAKWKIVFGHHPRYSSGLHGNASAELAKMLDTTVCNNADMYLSGHDHDLEHFKKKCGVEYLVVGSGGDGVRWVGHSEDTKFSRSTFGFSWFKITKNAMYFQLIDTEGNVMYDYRFSKY